MKILIYTPRQQTRTQGNYVTAERWARLLGDTGHHVRIVNGGDADELTGMQQWDILIALHATKSSQMIERWITASQRNQHRPVIVVITGTDLNVDLARSNEGTTDYRHAKQSLDAANQIVLLEPASLQLLAQLEHRYEEKTVVILQSAQPQRTDAGGVDLDPQWSMLFGDSSKFKVAVVGHLRKIKDPFAAAEAADLLPKTSSVHVLHWGAALKPDIKQRAETESKNNRRYDWLGSVSHRQSLILLQRCDVMVLSSFEEGGPAVLSEAIVNSVPIIAHEITATRGLLGESYLGFYQNANRQQLANLIHKSEQYPEFLAQLKRHNAELKDLFSESRELEKLQALVEGVVADRQ